MSSNKLISFDLQGTLSHSAFSDEFWLELLPSIYAEKNDIPLDEAKNILEKDFRQHGKYHALFYNHRLRLDALLDEWNFQDLIKRLRTPPAFIDGMLDLVHSLPRNLPKIIISATTRDFIDLELGTAAKYFDHTFSCINDFAIPGKPPHIYQKIATNLGISYHNCLHIGDCIEMDVMNARKAGWSCHHLDPQDTPDERIRRLKMTLTSFLDDAHETT